MPKWWLGLHYQSNLPVLTATSSGVSDNAYAVADGPTIWFVEVLTTHKMLDAIPCTLPPTVPYTNYCDQAGQRLAPWYDVLTTAHVGHDTTVFVLATSERRVRPFPPALSRDILAHLQPVTPT